MHIMDSMAVSPGSSDGSAGGLAPYSANACRASFFVLNVPIVTRFCEVEQDCLSVIDPKVTRAW